VTIDSDAQLELTQQRISELEKAISSARRRFADSPRAAASLVSLHQHQLDELQSEVRDYLGISRTVTAPVELSFETKDGTNGTASLSSLTAIVESFRGALTRIAESLVAGTVRSVGRPPARIARAVDLRLIGIANGSFRLLLEYPVSAPEGEEGGLADIVDRSLDVLDETIRWVESGESSPPAALENPSVRMVALSEVSKLAPSEAGSVSWVELRRSRPLRRPPRRLTALSSTAATRLLEASLPSEAVLVTGTLRAIDLDRNSFVVVTKEGRRHRCSLPPSLQAAAVPFILSQEPIVVRGTKHGSILEGATIEPAREPGPPQPPPGAA
jgi:hypothetical protein